MKPLWAARTAADPARTSPVVPPTIVSSMTLRSNVSRAKAPAAANGRTMMASIASSKYHLFTNSV